MGKVSLNLGIPGFYGTLVIMIKLGKTGFGLVAASWTGSSNDNQWFVGFDIIIRSVTLITYYEINIGRVSFCKVVCINLDSTSLQLVFEDNGSGLDYQSG